MPTESTTAACSGSHASLELAERTDAVPLRRVIRANIAGWTRQIHALRLCLEHPSGVGAIAYNGDGSILATGGDDGGVRIWDAKTGRQLGPPLIHR